MDWSSVFEETGEEDGDWERCEVEVSRISILQYFQNYNPLVAYFFTVNYVLGVGCLGIPYAFQQSGLILAPFIIVLVSIVSYVTVMYIAEVSHKGIHVKTMRTSTNPFLIAKLPTPQRKSNSNLSASNNGNSSSSLATATSSNSWFSLNALPLSSSGKSGPLSSQSQSQSLLSSDSNLELYNKYHSLSPPQTNRLTAAAIASNSGKSRNPLKSPRQPQRERFDSADSVGESEQIANKRHVEMEVTELAQEFLGYWGKVSYQSALTTLSMVGLLAYAQVFNDSFRVQVWPNCNPLVPMTIFGAIVVPLSCIDLVEQISVQVAMSVFRFLSLGILLFGTLLAIFYSPLDSDPAQHELHHHDLATTAPPIATREPLANATGFAVIFTTAIFAQLFQHSVPGLIRPLSSTHKRSVSYIFSGALFTTAMLYIAIGICCAYYFRNRTMQSINLNFVGFIWGLDRNDSTHGYALVKLAEIGSLIVVVFPALDTLSVFPLIANTLGNNFYAAVPKTKKYIKNWRIFGDDKQQLQLMAKILWRLVASVPPIVMSYWVSELSVSLQIAGICGIIVALITPALLHKAMLGYSISSSPSLLTELFSFEILESSELLVLCGTPYSSAIFSQPIVSTIVLFIAIVALIICSSQLLSSLLVGV